METWWMTVLIAVGSSLASSFATWVFSKKQYDSQVKNQDITNIDSAADVWQKIVKNLKQQVEELLVETKSLREENASLKEEMEKLREDLQKLKVETKKITRYEKQIKELEEKVRCYEQLLIANGIAY